MSDVHQQFAYPLLSWHEKNGRHDLPWQNPRTPYRVWLSEVMLQQTQVKTVIPYFLRFIERFPDVKSLANACEDEVLALWSGLGYYSRGRNLYKSAKIIQETYAGNIPADIKELIKLPGIGESTAAAIASLAYHQRTPILDGNVKRVLSRYFLITAPLTLRQSMQTLWQLAHSCMPDSNCANYTQAIMDLGATCCTIKNPACARCPLQKTCKAHLHNQMANIPVKKPKKEKPILTQQLIVIYNKKNCIFLEKRPALGIWGGLWGLPVIEASQDVPTYLFTTYGLKVDSPTPLMNFKHSFTHFQLNIQALHAKTASTGANDSEQGFFSADAISALGLPKPVSRIIQAFLLRDSVPVN